MGTTVFIIASCIVVPLFVYFCCLPPVDCELLEDRNGVCVISVSLRTPTVFYTQ